MDYKTILVIQTAYLGDAILCLPILKTVKARNPNSKVVFACRKGFGDFFRKIGVASEVIEIDKSTFESRRISFQKLKEVCPDMTISPQRSFRTALWVKLLRPKKSFGFKRWWNFGFFTDRRPWPMDKHDVLRQLSLIDSLPANVSLEIDLPESSQFSQFKDFIALAPGSVWPTKRWTADGFAELGQMLIDQGEQVVLIGSAGEREIAQELMLKLPAAVNLVGQTTLIELALLLRECKCVVSNDSGPMHMASLTGTPVVAIFGPTTQSLGFAPWNPKSRVVEASLGCRPCGSHGHMKCPIGTHDCMKLVTPTMVHSKINQVLQFS